MYRYLSFLVFVFFGFNMNVLAQDAYQKIFEIAQAYENAAEYGYAIKYFEKCYQQRPSKALSKKLSTCYFLIFNYDEARRWEKEYFDVKEATSEECVFHAKLLKSAEKYKDCKKICASFKSMGKMDSNTYSLFVASCDSSIKWLKQKKKPKVINLSLVNSAFSDVGPSLRSKHELVFSSNKEEIIIKDKDGINNLPYFDLYSTTITEPLVFSKPTVFSLQLNTNGHDCMAAFDRTGNEIYFSRTTSNVAGYRTSKNKLYHSVKKGLFWTETEVFRFDDTLSNFNHPYISQDGQLFFFSSDMPGGMGGMDLYVSFLVDSVWSDPVNLGPEINTSNNEVTPFFIDNVLYFSSDRIEGMGGYDVYSSVFTQDGDWLRVSNLKYPINTGSDDFGLIWDPLAKGRGYLSSNRKGSLGMEDIYLIRGYQHR